MSSHLRQYGISLDSSTPGSLLIRTSLRKAGSGSFASGTDWTPAAGEVLVSIDGGTQANITTLPSFSNGSWEFTLSGAELSGMQIRIICSAAAIDDEEITVETFGSALANYPTTYGSGGVGGVLTNMDALRAIPCTPSFYISFPGGAPDPDPTGTYAFGGTWANGCPVFQGNGFVFYHESERWRLAASVGAEVAWVSGWDDPESSYSGGPNGGIYVPEVVMSTGKFNRPIGSRVDELVYQPSGYAGAFSGAALAEAPGATAEEVAAAILVTPANKIKTNASNQVETSNPSDAVNLRVEQTEVRA